MLPPEGEEKLKVRAVDVARDGRARVGAGCAGEGCSDGNAVCREALVLAGARVGYLGNAPGRCARRADFHRERDSLPETINDGPAKFVVAGESRQHGNPVIAQRAEKRIARHGFHKVDDGSRSRGGAPGYGEREPAFAGVEV